MTSTKRDLFLSSLLMLFTELALIRWLGENVLYLSFFTNFILLASFLGIGIGFLRGQDDLRWFRWFGHLLLALVGVVTVFPVRINRSAAEVLFLGTGEPVGLPIWLILPLVFAFTAAVMASVAHGVARLFIKLEPLTAYRLDILGSIVGIAMFAGLAYAGSPPIVWALLIAGLFLYFDAARGGASAVAILGVVLILGIQSFTTDYEWSPYYRIHVVDAESSTSINVNGIPHQAMASLDTLERAGWVGVRSFELLNIHDPDNVLIIGAGSGNDVALALDAGAHHIDAVEIDPVIYEIGRDRHPEQPYRETDRVTVHIDDGRAFVERSGSEYDVILFALTDSLTVVSGQANLRLESYLFTEESISAAMHRLSDDGVLVLYNVHSDQWVIDRMGRTLQTVFDQRPCYRLGGGIEGATIAVGAVEDRCQDGELRDFSSGPVPATDDFPFLYVQERGIPGFYLVAIGAILLVTLAALGLAVRGWSEARDHVDLAFMGAAFLLLETTGIVRFALWFGTTWIVNALVFTSILGSVLLAIEVVARFRLPPLAVLYALLGLSLIATWAIPAHTLLQLPAAARLAAAAGLTFAPVFLANVIFAERFSETSSSTVAFGTNLLGAMVGGLLEYLSLAVGYRNLTILVAALYAAAFVAWRRLEPPIRLSTLTRDGAH